MTNNKVSEWGKWKDADQRVLTLVIRWISSEDLMQNMMIIINNTGSFT